eukprot:7122109-Pyramimonas_sp.AAC.1
MKLLGSFLVRFRSPATRFSYRRCSLSRCCLAMSSLTPIAANVLSAWLMKEATGDSLAEHVALCLC